MIEHIDCNFILRSHRSFERNKVFKNDLKQLGKDLEIALYIHLHRSTAIDNIDNIDNRRPVGAKNVLGGFGGLS